MAEKVALVDLDGVLFNIKAFKEWYFRFLLESFFEEYPTHSVLASYEQSKKDGFYDPDSHIALLSEASRIPAFDLRKKIESSMRVEAQQFIYPDAELFLQLLAERGYEIWIATAGVDWFQEEKVPVDFYRFIDGVKVTQDVTKVSVVGRFADPEKDDIVFFDDTRQVIDKVKEVFSRVYAVHIDRDHKEKNLPCVSGMYANAHAHNLEEALGAVIHRPR